MAKLVGSNFEELLRKYQKIMNNNNNKNKPRVKIQVF